MNCALAIFVKTPELSPVKTRLASSIGKESARAVYEESIRATAAAARSVAELSKGKIIPHWAVGEGGGVNHFRWQEFARLHTGDGGLGERLCRVYDELRARFSRVILMGSDSPQISPKVILRAASESGHIFGPAADGGFYLFASEGRFPSAMWREVEYSRDDTMRQLAARIKRFGDDNSPINYLPPLIDIDDLLSLGQVAEILLSADLPEQRQMAKWLQSKDFSTRERRSKI